MPVTFDSGSSARVGRPLTQDVAGSIQAIPSPHVDVSFRNTLNPELPLTYCDTGSGPRTLKRINISIINLFSATYPPVCLLVQLGETNAACMHTVVAWLIHIERVT